MINNSGLRLGLFHVKRTAWEEYSPEDAPVGVLNEGEELSHLLVQHRVLRLRQALQHQLHLNTNDAEPHQNDAVTAPGIMFDADTDWVTIFVASPTALAAPAPALPPTITMPKFKKRTKLAEGSKYKCFK
jgi:hypothetical protein